MNCIECYIQKNIGGIFGYTINNDAIEKLKLTQCKIANHICGTGECIRENFMFNLIREKLFIPSINIIDAIKLEDYQEHTVNDYTDMIIRHYNDNNPFFKFKMISTYELGKLKFYRFDYFYGLEFFEKDIIKIKFITIEFNSAIIKVDIKDGILVLFPFPILCKFLTHTIIEISFYDFEDCKISQKIDVNILAGISSFPFLMMKEYNGNNYRYNQGMISFKYPRYLKIINFLYNTVFTKIINITTIAKA